MASDLKRCHVEIDNDKSVIRRWVTGVLDEMETLDQSRKMQTMKILKSDKISSTNKWALAIVPLEEFNVFNCVTTKQVVSVCFIFYLD
jgi:hypothetical protein